MNEKEISLSITYADELGETTSLTDNQVRQANEKFTKQFQKALYEM